MNRIEFGDNCTTMKRWAEEGIKAQMCVTSPPYFGLRSYLPDDSPDKPLEIGLEETPEQYISSMVEVFRCVRDVLADDGVIWVNIGDSYCSTAPGTRNAPQSKGDRDHADQWANVRPPTPVGMKPKDLIGIPWMLAFALRADGWYLRQELIWAKPNAMPESVKDRCTKAHEHIFLLSKQSQYYFDSESIKEPSKTAPVMRDKAGEGYHADYAKGDRFSEGARMWGDGLANKRSVWTVNTKPYSGSHFAVYPEELISPCILAGSRKGDIVLDPFMGSGTTAAVALKHGRRYLGCELNRDYEPLQNERIEGATDLFSLGGAETEPQKAVA